MSPDREAASKPDGALGSVSAVPVARILVDTGMTELHPEVADLDPRLVPLSEQAFDLAGVDVVVNTHLHFEPLRRQPPLRRTADLRSAAGARGRADGGRLHDPRVGPAAAPTPGPRRWCARSRERGTEHSEYVVVRSWWKAHWQPVSGEVARLPPRLLTA